MYDAIVVGAGPAGGQFARELSRRGRKVLLVERCAEFSENDFSSAGTPLETIPEFGLPEEVVGSYCRKITVLSAGVCKSWQSPERLGAVLDFAALRGFLAAQTRRHGGEVLMGHSFKRFRREDGSLVARFETRGGGSLACRARLLVDATGYRRAVMNQVGPPPEDYMDCLGLEYLIEVPAERYIAEEMVFLVGERWIEKGYSWVFPMGRSRLKVGSGRISGARDLDERSLKRHVELVLREFLRLDGFKLLDQHGGRVVYSRSQGDLRSGDGVLALGDAISAINPLGGEGIRHGMRSANIAAEHADRYLSGDAEALGSYSRAMKDYFGAKWEVSLKTSDVLAQLDEAGTEQVVRLASRLTTEEFVEILFQYKLGGRLSRYGEVSRGLNGA